MNPTEAFMQARDALLRNREDLERARAEFRWPQLASFNWAFDWFDVLAQRNDRTALTLVSERRGIEKVTFAELSDRSLRIARYFLDQGVKPGDRILLMLNNEVPLWVVMLATIRVGAVLIPATTQLTQNDVDDRLVRGDVRHVVTNAESTPKFASHLARLGVKLSTEPAEGFVGFDDALASPAQMTRIETRATDPLLLYFTSGTTAKPKLVEHTHASYPVGHLSTMYWLGIREGDVHQNVSSPGWAKHAWSSFFAPWNANASILVHDAPRFSAKRTIEVLHEHGVNTFCAPPTVWRMLILESLGAKPPALRELASAGEPLNPEVIETVKQAWGITIRDGFGQTETTAQIGNPPGFTVKPGSMGKPLPGYDVVLLDGEGHEGDEGEVVLKLSPRPMALMTGYQGDEARTAEVMAGGFYRTGDEARRDEDGYIFFVGRGDDVFKSSDYRISPFELESVLLEHPLVAEAAIVPSPDGVRLAVPKAVIVLVPGTEPSRGIARQLFDFCSERLAPFKRVRRIEFAELPKTISGKIRRVELRKQEAARRVRGERGPLEFWIDDQPLKRIEYRGGLISFRIPSHWVEEYEPGGGEFYEDGPDTPTLRLNVLSFEGKTEKSEVEITRSSKAFIEDDDACVMTTWQIEQPLPPNHLRVFVFTFTTLASEPADDDLALIDSELRKATFST